MVIDQHGNIYIATLAGVSYWITKLNADSSVVWSVTSSLSVMEQSMKVSPDSTFIIFTDGNSVMVKLDTSTGLNLGSVYAGNYSISDLYASAISFDSSTIVVGGTDN